MLTYVEGNSLHPERGGAAVLARYAFNELWSFIAGWAILLDFLIVLAIGAVAVPHYLGAFWGGADDGAVGVLISAATIAWVAWANFQGVSAERFKVVLRLSLLSVVVFAGDPGDRRRPAVRPRADHRLDRPGHHAAVDDLVFAMVIGHRGLHRHRGGLRPGRPTSSCAVAQLRRVALVGAAAALVLYVAVSVIALMAVPVGSDGTAPGRRLRGRPGAGRGVRLRAGRAGGGLALRGGPRRSPGTGPGRQRPDAGHRPAGVLAGHHIARYPASCRGWTGAGPRPT